MIKRLLIILFVLAIATGLLSRSAVAGPPWPAQVYFQEDVCISTWLDADLNFISIYGDGIWVVQEKNQQATLACHTTLDFDTMATPAQACEYLMTLGYPDFCNGPTFRVHGIDCAIYDETITNNSQYLVTPSGQMTLECHYKP
jgi:hypothetical protein